MDKHVAISRVLGTLTQLASPAGRPDARQLPIETMRAAFAQFIEYAETVGGDEHVDAPRHQRALPFIRAMAPLLDEWTLDTVPRNVILAARAAMDAWFPENGGPELWSQTDLDAERSAGRECPSGTFNHDPASERPHPDEDLLRKALGLPPDGADIRKDERS